jgi:hypothetical protein
VRGRIANAKSFGWAIYAAGLATWLFGYLSAGHAPLFDWNAATPWWISRFVPNLEAEFGLALMFASMVPIYWPRGTDASAMGDATTSSRPDRSERLSAGGVAALLVFAAVTLGWWGVLAWLMWHVI